MVVADLIRIADQHRVQLDNIGLLVAKLIASTVTADHYVLGRVPPWEEFSCRRQAAAESIQVPMSPDHSTRTSTQATQAPLSGLVSSVQGRDMAAWL